MHKIISFWMWRQFFRRVCALFNCFKGYTNQNKIFEIQGGVFTVFWAAGGNKWRVGFWTWLVGSGEQVVARGRDDVLSKCYWSSSGMLRECFGSSSVVTEAVSNKTRTRPEQDQKKTGITTTLLTVLHTMEAGADSVR